MPLPASAGALAGLTPGFTQLPACTAPPKGTQFGSAWGFLGGIDVKGVPQSTTGAIVEALKKGIGYSDNGVALTLLVSSVTAVQPASGRACGSSEAGFQVSGGIKEASGHTWTLTLCLSGGTGAGTNQLPRERPGRRGGLDARRHRCHGCDQHHDDRDGDRVGRPVRAAADGVSTQMTAVP